MFDIKTPKLCWCVISCRNRKFRSLTLETRDKLVALLLCSNIFGLGPLIRLNQCVLQGLQWVGGPWPGTPGGHEHRWAAMKALFGELQQSVLVADPLTPPSAVCPVEWPRSASCFTDTWTTLLEASVKINYMRSHLNWFNCQLFVKKITPRKWNSSGKVHNWLKDSWSESVEYINVMTCMNSAWRPPLFLCWVRTFCAWTRWFRTHQFGFYNF